MKNKFYILPILLVLIAFSCQSQKKIDNTQPMYGEVEKSEKYKDIDKEFINECLNTYGTIDSAVSFHLDYAWRYYYHNELENAMKRFNQVWLLNPEYPDSYFGFASLLETQGKTEKAIRFYRIGKEKDKIGRSEICYQRIADCKEKNGDIKGTIRAYEEISKINPKNSFAFKKIGYLEMSIGEMNNAIKAYDNAIILDPNDAMTYNNRAYLYQQLNKYDLAVKDYSKAIELNPNYISAIVNRGITYMEIHEFEKAKQDFSKTVELDNKSGELRKFLGLSLLNLNKREKACVEFKKALDLGDRSVNELIEKNCQ